MWGLLGKLFVFLRKQDTAAGSATASAASTNSATYSDSTTTTTDSNTPSYSDSTTTAAASTTPATDSTSSTITNIEQEAAAVSSLFSVSNPSKRKHLELHNDNGTDNLANQHEESKKKRKIIQADDDSKRKRKRNRRVDDSKRERERNQRVEDTKRKRKGNQHVEDSERKRRIKTTSIVDNEKNETPNESEKLNTEKPQFSIVDDEKNATPNESEKLKTEKPQLGSESNERSGEEKMKKKKKRKRDEVEREYEAARRSGLPLDHETDKNKVVAVGEKRKKPDGVSDSFVLDEVEGFDDESKLLRTVFVRNFPLHVKKKAILEAFRQFGEIESVLIRIADVAKNPRKRASLPKNFNGAAADSGDAYIVFKTTESADGSLRHNDVAKFRGNHIHVDRVCPPRKKSKAGDARNLPFVSMIPDLNLPFVM